MARFGKKLKKQSKSPKKLSPKTHKEAFDADAARAQIKAIDELDLTSASLAELKRRISALFNNVTIVAPSLDIGTKVFSIFVGPKPLRLEQISSSASGPLDLEPGAVLYCGLAKHLAFFQHSPVATAGQEISFVEWEVVKPIPLNRLGFSDRGFKKLGFERKANPPGTPQDVESAFVVDYLSEKFLLIAAEDKATSPENKLKVAITQAFLEPCGSVIFPAMCVKGSSDFFAINPDYVTTHLRFCRVEYIRIEEVEGESASTKALNLCWQANSKGDLEWYIDSSGVPRYGTFGWEEFVRQKKDILSVYDAAKESGKNRPVRTEHGSVGEGKFREWLSEFLPKKYAVTSGYIIPEKRVMSYTLRHYDIIIYDVFNSPVLFASNNPDHSDQGRHRAIPAKNVHAVFEVKAAFNSKSISDSLEKLQSLEDCVNDLPKAFASGAIFLEVLQDEQTSCKLAEKLLDIIPGYFGGLILRAEGMDPLLSGYYTWLPSNTPTIPEMKLVRDPGILHRNLDGEPQLRDQGDYAMATSFDGIWNFDKGYSPVVKDVHLLWSYNSFTSFVFDLLARMDGTYKPGEVGSAGSYGRSFNR